MSNEKTSSVLEGNAKPGVTDPLINKQNLALLHKRDRTVIIGAGLVMSIAGTTIVTPESDNPQVIVVFAGTTVFAVIALPVLVYVRASNGTEGLHFAQCCEVVKIHLSVAFFFDLNTSAPCLL